MQEGGEVRRFLHQGAHVAFSIPDAGVFKNLEGIHRQEVRSLVRWLPFFAVYPVLPCRCHVAEAVHLVGFRSQHQVLPQFVPGTLSCKIVNHLALGYRLAAVLEVGKHQFFAFRLQGPAYGVHYAGGAVIVEEVVAIGPFGTQHLFLHVRSVAASYGDVIGLVAVFLHHFPKGLSDFPALGGRQVKALFRHPHVVAAEIAEKDAHGLPCCRIVGKPEDEFHDKVRRVEAEPSEVDGPVVFRCADAKCRVSVETVYLVPWCTGE